MNIDPAYKRLFIIGNADNTLPIDTIINTQDFIVRFNQPNDSCPLKADLLFVANGPRMIMRKTILSNDMLNKGGSIVWRYSIKDILFSRYEKISLSRKLRYPFFFRDFKKLNQFNHHSSVYYDQSMQDYCTNLVQGAIPSSGFLAIFMLKSLYPNIPIYIHNFTFQGWEGHNWNIEETIIQKWIDSGEVQLTLSLF